MKQKPEQVDEERAHMRNGIFASVLLAALPLCAFASGGEAECAPVPGAGTKSIVVYFSATGNTRAAAEKIAKLTGSEIMEIEPAEKYTDADLNWHDGESRSSVEMNDESSRPAIKADSKAFGDYGTVFLGYPIWWGKAPRVLYTFVEKHDFSGRTVIPFCTSGVSPAGDSAKLLEELSGNRGTWKETKRFGEHPSESEISEWLSESGYGVKR